jgi:hypothetical protein
MDNLTAADIALIRLRRAGWSVGDTAFSGPRGTTWVVSGSSGENFIRAMGATQSAAWAEAERQARELGMIDRTPGRASLAN